MNKKGLTWHNDWVEILGINFLLIGFLIALSTRNAFVNYIVILIAGFLAGRVTYFRKYKFKMSVIIIIVLFLLGYMIGSKYGNTWTTFLFFILGATGSYRLHTDGYLKK